jgi:hypothetical protein
MRPAAPIAVASGGPRWRPSDPRRLLRMVTTSLLLCAHAEAAHTFSMSTQAQNLQLLEDALLSYRGFPPPPLRSSGTLEVATPDGVVRADKVHGEAGPFLRARGVQYAAHPEGKLRWQPPVPRGPWSGVLDATAYGDDCIQGPLLNRLQEIGPARMSERCLFLNVWAPVGAPTGSLPVLVWIHGGSFTAGGTTARSKCPCTTPSALQKPTHLLGAALWPREERPRRWDGLQ